MPEPRPHEARAADTLDVRGKLAPECDGLILQVARVACLTWHKDTKSGIRHATERSLLRRPQDRQQRTSRHRGRESFDLQVPGKLYYSLMDQLAREGFDVFALDTSGFGRSPIPTRI